MNSSVAERHSWPIAPRTVAAIVLIAEGDSAFVERDQPGGLRSRPDGCAAPE